MIYFTLSYSLVKKKKTQYILHFKLKNFPDGFKSFFVKEI